MSKAFPGSESGEPGQALENLIVLEQGELIARIGRAAGNHVARLIAVWRRRLRANFSSVRPDHRSQRGARPGFQDTNLFRGDGRGNIEEGWLRGVLNSTRHEATIHAARRMEDSRKLFLISFGRACPAVGLERGIDHSSKVCAR